MMTKEQYYFYFPREKDIKDFLAEHPEFVQSERFSDSYAYTAKDHKYSLHFIKPPKRKRYRFNFVPNIATVYIFKLMQLYKEGWVEPSPVMDESDVVTHSHELTEKEWAIIKELRRKKEENE